MSAPNQTGGSPCQLLPRPSIAQLPARRGPAAVPGEGDQREDTQQQLHGVEEQEDGVEDGFQAQGVGLQQQVIGRHHGRWDSQGQADGERHLPLAQVPLGSWGEHD